MRLIPCGGAYFFLADPADTMQWPTWAMERTHGCQVEVEGRSHVYKLPLSACEGVYLPLHEHTAMLVATGLLHEDLEDQYDTLRGAIEIDPLLAAWCVLEAYDHAGIELRSLTSTARWLARSFRSRELHRSFLESLQLTATARQRWRSVTTRAVSVGRQVHALAQQSSATTSAQAVWFSTLWTTQRQLCALSKHNGKAPLQGVPIEWPPWIQRAFDELAAALPAAELERACLSDESRHVSPEEQALWFRPYPEFHSLMPLLMQRLRRLHALEEDFSTTLQNEKLASLQQLAYGASHEINNPLANISTRAQTLMHNEGDADRRRKLLAINDQAFRAYEMIADLMLFAKPPQMETSSLDAQAILQSVRDELAETARERDVRIHVYTETLPPLVGDPVQLGVACKAICQNGVEAMPDGGELTIRCRHDTPTATVQILIQDQGIGLSDFVRRHCFDPFFSGREAGRGLGFGLSKAWRIIEQHRGKIEVSTPDGAGTCFVVSLPVAGRQPDLTPQRAASEDQ